MNDKPGQQHWRVRNRHLFAADAVGCILVLGLAFAARFEGLAWPDPYRTVFWSFLPVMLVTKIAVFFMAGFYRRLWRYSGMLELERLAAASLVAAVITSVLGVWLLPAMGLLPTRLPISVAVLDGVLTVAVAAWPRLFIRWRRGAGRRRRRTDDRGGRVLIAGAGSAGELVLRELRRSHDLEIVPVGFVDDDPMKHGQTMADLPVLGPISRLAEYRDRLLIDELIVAMPSAPGGKIREVMQQAAAAGLKARTVPGMFEILAGRVNVTTLRPIEIEDLLRREPVRTDLDLVQGLVEGKTVLVTGAGGSIGTELCRQVGAQYPGRLIMLGHGENSIFNALSEITSLLPSLDVVPVIADVRDRARMAQIMRLHRPAVVFHAAAHKHVPMMELNVVEAVTNNVAGVLNTVETAIEVGTECFVMISTDKAVKPTNVMGATKRIAEQIVQELGQAAGRRFISVRFGNVLGSRGSVVPIFRRQIEQGGPVNVTHPEMRRYFMTIPESVQLVLQAAVQGEGGEVFVLDMGEPVRIVDLAHDLIRLSGYEVGKDIEVKFTGVRPGEKLYEEMFFGREEAEPTKHPKVLKARHADLPVGLSSVIAHLIERAALGAPDDELRTLIQRLVPDYSPEGSAHNVSGFRGREAPSLPTAASERAFKSPRS